MVLIIRHQHKIFAQQQPRTMSSSLSNEKFSEDSVICSTDSDEDAKTRMQEKNKNNSPSHLSLYLLLMRRRSYLRSVQWSPPRLMRSDYVAELIHQNEFNVTFRMSLVSFQKLAELLRPALSLNESPSNCALSGSGLFCRSWLLPCHFDGWLVANGRTSRKSTVSTGHTFTFWEGSLWMHLWLVLSFK